VKTFANNLAALMPEGITLPPELTQTFDWLEDQGGLVVRRAGAPEDHTLMIYPPELHNHPAASHFGFVGTALPYTSNWTTPDPSVDARIAEIGETSGDGGRLAIWLDDAGKQHFVHIGHDTLGVITDDPAVLLQFLAMGYPEPGYLPQTDRLPLACYLSNVGVDRIEDLPEQDRPVPPVAFQTFLKHRFNLDIPATAQDLGITPFPEYHDSDTDDPFARWIAANTPEPNDADLAYELELMRAVETLDLKDDDTSDAIMAKIGSLFTSNSGK
jgi:hypothetical protein